MTYMEAEKILGNLAEELGVSTSEEVAINLGRAALRNMSILGSIVSDAEKYSTPVILEIKD